MNRTLIAWACLFVFPACAAKSGGTATSSVAPGINDRYQTEDGRAASLKIFEADDREKYQKSDEVIRNMDLKPGDVVCEVGAGSGYFTPFLARAVGRTGKVYAEDPQAEFLEELRSKKTALGLTNVEVVLGTYTDTNLPDRLCDVTVVLDTYHHFEWPAPMLDAMKRDLKPGGRLVIIDFYRRQNDLFDAAGVDARKHLRLDLEGVVAEIAAHGWKHVETRAFLPDQYFAVFTPR